MALHDTAYVCLRYMNVFGGAKAPQLFCNSVFLECAPFHFNQRFVFRYTLQVTVFQHVLFSGRRLSNQPQTAQQKLTAATDM